MGAVTVQLPRTSRRFARSTSAQIGCATVPTVSSSGLWPTVSATCPRFATCSPSKTCGPSSCMCASRPWTHHADETHLDVLVSVTPQLAANGAAVVSILVVLFAAPLLLGSYVVTQRSGVILQFVWFGGLVLLLG